MKLEKLLNSLIERGWKPQDDYGIGKITYHKDYGYLFHDKDGLGIAFSMQLRDLVSMNSGLWQFVCKNKLTKTNKNGKYLWECYFQYNNSEKIMAYQKNGLEYEYWLIESALIPDNKLENFILENVDISY